MINTKILRAGSVAAGAALALSVALPVFAENLNVGVTGSTTLQAGKGERGQNGENNMEKAGIKAEAKAQVKAKTETARIDQIRAKANQEIDRRIASLEKLKARIGQMKRISESQKTALSATVTAQITALQTLKTKIAADTALEALKADTKSITDSYRIYALIMPQIEVLAAADRLGTLIDTMTAVGAKLQTQITQAKTAGKDVSRLETALAEYTGKIADAKVEAQAAISGVIGLTPDQGDKTKAEANQQALKDARAKIKAGEQSLKAARQSIENITKSFKAVLNLKMKAETNASATASTTVR